MASASLRGGTAMGNLTAKMARMRALTCVVSQIDGFFSDAEMLTEMVLSSWGGKKRLVEIVKANKSEFIKVCVLQTIAQI